MPVIVFVHGGSWNKGDPENYGFIGRAFVPEGFVVVLAAYRLHPEAVYPAMIEDTAAAIAWTQANIAKLIEIGKSKGEINKSIHSLDFAKILYSRIQGAVFMMYVMNDPNYMNSTMDDVEQMIRNELTIPKNN